MSIRRRIWQLPLIGVVTMSLFGTSPVDAGSAGSSFAVSATVVAACIVSASALAFGNYDPTSASATTGQTTLSVTCTNGATYTIALGNGNGTGADATAGASGRKMTKSSTLLGYNLYQDSGFAQYWGTTGAAALSGTGTGSAQTINVYGRIPAQQTVTAGSYTDSVSVTVNF